MTTTARRSRASGRRRRPDARHGDRRAGPEHPGAVRERPAPRRPRRRYRPRSVPRHRREAARSPTPPRASGRAGSPRASAITNHGPAVDGVDPDLDLPGRPEGDERLERRRVAERCAGHRTERALQRAPRDRWDGGPRLQRLLPPAATPRPPRSPSTGRRAPARSSPRRRHRRRRRRSPPRPPPPRPPPRQPSATPTPTPTATTPTGTLPSSFRWSSTGPIIAPSGTPRTTRSRSRTRRSCSPRAGCSVLRVGRGERRVQPGLHELRRLVPGVVRVPLLPRPLGDRHGLPGRPAGVLVRAAALLPLSTRPARAAGSPTTPTISDPSSWSAPKNFYSAQPQIIRDNIGDCDRVDFWTVCDTTTCYLFSSIYNGHLYRSETPLTSFPGGFTEHRDRARGREPLPALRGLERLQGRGPGHLAAGARGVRHGRQAVLRSWTAPLAQGPWAALADTEANPFARSNNVTFPGGAWTRTSATARWSGPARTRPWRSAPATCATSTRGWTPRRPTTTSCRGGSAC